MRKGPAKGFTLIELMVTIMVVGIVLSVGVPAFTEFIATNRVAASVNDLLSSLHLARSEAVKRRTNASLCASADWNSPNPSCDLAGQIGDGWIVFTDCTTPPPNLGGACGPANLTVDPFDVVLEVHGPMLGSIPPGFNSAPVGGTDYVSFAATGFPAPAAGQGPPKTNFQICDDRGNHDTGGGIAAGRWIQIANTGRPQVYRLQAEIQSASNPLAGC